MIEELSGTTSFEHINNLRDEPVNRDALNGAFGSSAPRFLATARINAIPTRLAYLQDAVSASSHILNDEDAPAPLLPKIVAEAVRRPLPQLRIDIDIFDDQMKQQLLNPLAMKVSEAFDMYIAVKRAGYGDEFHMTQKRLPLRGAKFEKNTYPGLKVARKFWVALLDDCEGSPPGFNGVWP